MTSNTEKAREQRCRQRLASRGFQLIKSRGRIEHADDWLGYQIVELEFNRIEAGERFDMTLEAVESWVADTLEEEGRHAEAKQFRQYQAAAA
jgi:hypothetical protein